MRLAAVVAVRRPDLQALNGHGGCHRPRRARRSRGDLYAQQCKQRSRRAGHPLTDVPMPRVRHLDALLFLVCSTGSMVLGERSARRLRAAAAGPIVR